MKIFKCACLIAAFVVAGCAGVPESRYVELLRAYDAGEFSLDGATELHVNAFLRTRGGDVKLCSGYEVALWKATLYSGERVGHLYDQLGNLYVGNPASRNIQFSSAAPFMITRTCDSAGNVVFKGVPPGRYYVSSIVMWDVYSSSVGGLMGSGGRTAKVITVTDADDRIDLVLTR